MNTKISPKNYKYLSNYIDKIVEPTLQDVINKVNSFLASKKLRVGLECQWYFEEIPESEENEEKTK